jgi:hypothetical protein
MTIQRRFAPISGRFEPEQVAGFTGIYIEIHNLLNLMEKAEKGEDALARRTGFVRRAFLSKLDNILQPYTVKIPNDYDPQKKLNEAARSSGCMTKASISGLCARPMSGSAHVILFRDAPHGHRSSTSATFFPLPSTPQLSVRLL